MESPSSPKRARTDADLSELSKEELINRIKDQEKTIRQLEEKQRNLKTDDKDLKEVEAKLKQHQRDAARRENTLVHRLTTKEQELQDYINQIQEFKQSQTQNKAQLQKMHLDPAVNLVFQRMTKEMEECQEKLKQTQNELSAWKFTPDSQTGKRLMAKCRMLLQENEELGKVITSGRTAKLEGEIAVQKQLVQEMKGNQSELDEFLGDLEEDVEGMQSMIYALQQQLKETKEQVSKLEEENSKLKSSVQTGAVSQTSNSAIPSSSPTLDLKEIKQEMDTDPVKQEIKCERTTEFEETSERTLHRWSSQEEMMDTDQDSRDVPEVNHITHRLQPGEGVKCSEYESSQDGWSSPYPQTKDDINGSNKHPSQSDSTPEMDHLSDKGYSGTGDLLPNGVNRTPLKEEMGEA
ncbi:pre-mRNA-splicing regulator WTAP-like [Saccostrea cucullata]|uniref:pre-mRNA-splicing regulator WTAP-like n=1 Tax=Saccostrea cuccullata TaxID=36930 RepID=UPI002ED4D660